MELHPVGNKTTKFAHEDFLSSFPDILINNILDRLPLQDAVRTCILSRIWRFKWTMLSQVILDDRFFSFVLKKYAKASLVISRILLHLRGPITKFVLSIEDKDVYEVLDVEDIDHLILFLSRKGITDVTFKFNDDTTVNLPTQLFSCLELKHLELHNCSFYTPTSFHGFPKLLTLKLRLEFEKNNDFVKLFTHSPLIEMLKLCDLDVIGKVKLVEIAKLKSLNILSLYLCDLDDPEKITCSTIFELVGSLPKLQELDLNFMYKKLTKDVSKKGLSIAFPCLKTLKLSSICLDDGLELSCVFELIRGFPYLQTLEITPVIDRNVEPSPEVAYDTMGPLLLQRVVCKDLKGSEGEVCLIKCLLACSPYLKRISIHTSHQVSSDKKLMFAMKLLKFRRASTLAEIDLFHF